ncbi:hypothetical protein [Pedobacter gandavensis]|uniref:hypothetical protein n=1 Tax=Pedobacter gandavensis TaxID=2679963 RepID=UPI0029310252|nr:hypothetical protein [Pedobacter gandavensis]
MVNKGDRNKIYFLIVVILALLGTNAYLYLKDRHQSERYISIGSEIARVKLEVEKVEAELDKVNVLNVQLTDKLQEEQRLARVKIAELKLQLKGDVMSSEAFVAAQNDVKNLREFVKSYKEEISRLERENAYLRNQKDSLKEFAYTASQKVDNLEKKNTELQEKVKTGAALKAGNVSILAYKVKNSGKNIEVTRAGSAKKLTVSFNIAPNPLAAKDYHKIYLRVFDPAGNLIANGENLFEADGEQMQYTSATSISYNDDNTVYKMDWINPNPFIKGTYSVILYADGFTMGKAAIELK